ncbi:MAG: hypothetical protein IJX13_03080 [Clostridia bacterium]|nr:hypothetical protein [Clostridia bacterium]
MRIAKRILKIVLIVLAALLALVLLIWGGLHLAKLFLYPDYYGGAAVVSPLPNIHGGFVPQGLGYDAETDTYLHSGYNGKQTELYLVNGSNTKLILPVYLGETEPAKGHGGGIAVAGDYVYVADNADEGDGRFGAVHVFRFSDLQNAEYGAKVKAIDMIPVDSSASFCFADASYLYVGEFYRAGPYETDPSHHFTTPAGDENKAILTALPLKADGSVADRTPAFAASIPDQVQGFAIHENGTVMVSRSWGLNPSYLDIYSGWADTKGTVTLSDKEIPLYYLDSSTMEKSIAMPAFSEGLAILGDGRVAVSFESACNKYIIGKFFFATNVVAFEVPDYQ